MRTVDLGEPNRPAYNSFLAMLAHVLNVPGASIGN